MKFFNWMQNKFINGRQQDISKLPDGSVPVPASCVGRREPPIIGDLSDGGLLTIGTFGNHDHVPENHQDNRRPRPPVVENPEEIDLSPDLAEFTPGEFGKLQKELIKLLKRKPKATAVAAAAGNADHDSPPLDRFFNCPSSLSTLDRTISSRYSTNSSIFIPNDDQIIEETEIEIDDDIDRTIRIIIGRCKEVSKMNKGIFGKKSVSFLLKKMFLCSSGQFAPPPPPAPAPGLRDTIQQSRMEKLLRTLMISKKMYQTQQNECRASSTKRILESKEEEKEDDDNQVLEKRAESHKWVKTDSEYIVLDLD